MLGNAEYHGARRAKLAWYASHDILPGSTVVEEPHSGVVKREARRPKHQLPSTQSQRSLHAGLESEQPDGPGRVWKARRVSRTVRYRWVAMQHRA